MSGLEFLHAYDKSWSDVAAAMEPLLCQFVSEGYHKVPDCSPRRPSRSKPALAYCSPISHTTVHRAV